MKTNSLFKFLIAVFAAILLFASCQDDDKMVTNEPPTTQEPTPDPDPKKMEEVVAVANINSPFLSFIDVHDGNKVTNLSIGDAPALTYVVYVEETDRLYVGDRGQDGSFVHVIDPNTRKVEISIELPDGVFHMWADEKGEKLWVACDRDNVLAAIDLSTNQVAMQIAIAEGKPHDTFAADGKVYTSVITDKAEYDIVKSYDATTYAELASVQVPKDPHLFFSTKLDGMFVATHDNITLRDKNTLLELMALELKSPHGIYVDEKQGLVYCSSIGEHMLYTVSTDGALKLASSVMNQDGVTVPPSGIHNIVLNDDNTILYGTNYGSESDKVSIYNVELSHPQFIGAVTVGKNPFGITYYKRQME